MEMSSPLAAMHPPPVPAPWGYRRDLPNSKLCLGAKNLNFNFRDLSMKKPTDYFALPNGSSPTASLAADMSANLNVDQRYGERPCIQPLEHKEESGTMLTGLQSDVLDAASVALYRERTVPGREAR